MKTKVRLLAAVCAVLLLGDAVHSAESGLQPNIVIFLVDEFLGATNEGS
jgi:Na+/H+ antiporter NhaB